MAGNIIYITFNEDLPIGSNLFISGLYSSVGGNVSLQPNWNWIALRNAPFTVTTGTPTTIPGERSAINFMQAFQLDYGGTGQHTVTRNANVLTITSLYTTLAGYIWDGGFAFKPNPGGGFPLLGDVEFVFTFNANNTPFTVKSLTFTPYFLNPCRYVTVNIEASKKINNVLQPVQASNVNSFSYSFMYSRGAAANLIMQDYGPQVLTVTQAFQTPALLTPENYTIDIFNSPNGATLVINYTNQYLLTPTYAISPPDTSPTSGSYQSSNVFGGIAPGTYWLSIKDQFGCIKTKTFTVQETGALSPFFYISKAMSIRYANRVVWGDAGNYKTDENTLSCEVDTKIRYKEIQQFQTADVITTQFKSNYTNNTAKIIKADGTTVDIPVIQMSNNIGVKDRRDAIKVNLGNNKTGVYFQSGNTYDYDTGVTTGTYALNGALPYWASQGNYFKLDNIWFQIDEVYYDEVLNVDMLVANVAYTGTPVEVQVSSIFNLFNYEVYEFTIDFVDYQNQKLQVEIYCDDPEFGDVRLLSEVIHVKVRHAGTVEIKYRNSKNTDVFYSTGITNLIRQPLALAPEGVPDEASETYKTDNTTILQSSEVYEVTRFTFEPVTKEIMRKMLQAFNHDTLQMDGVFYVKNAPCEVEGPLEQSNLYVIKAVLIKTAGAFVSNLTGNGNEIFDTTNVEIPGLIDTGDATFVEY